MRRLRRLGGGGGAPSSSVVRAPVKRSSRVAVAAVAWASAVRERSGAVATEDGRAPAAAAPTVSVRAGCAHRARLLDAVVRRRAGRRLVGGSGRRTGGASRDRRRRGIRSLLSARLRSAVRGRVGRRAIGSAGGCGAGPGIRELAEQIRERIVERRGRIGHVRRTPGPGGRGFRVVGRCSSRRREPAAAGRPPRPDRQCYESFAGICPHLSAPHAPTRCSGARRRGGRARRMPRPPRPRSPARPAWRRCPRPACSAAVRPGSPSPRTRPRGP